MADRRRPRLRIAVRRLEDLAGIADHLEGVRRGEVGPGDRILVATRNSIYSLLQLDDGRFEVAGGWYQRSGRGPVQLGISGCSAGGAALFTRLLAAPGLFLEFDDGTRTTRIQNVRLQRLAVAS